MSDDVLANLLRLLNTDRFAELKQQCGDDPDKLADAVRVAKLIEAGSIDVSCDDCGSWDGIDRRCNCGNRRVYWEWYQLNKHFFAECY